MSAVISGTNGLLQSVDYPTLTTGFTYNWPSGYTVAVFNPGGTLSSGTINLPTSSLVEGMVITFSSSQQITSLTMSGGSASIVGAVTFLPAKTAVSYVYRATGTTWYPTVTVPGTGSQLVSGTSQASTSGTSIDFTSIPSWAKRITLMFQGVSTSGTSTIQIQLGTGAGPTYTTSGYLGNSQAIASASAAIGENNGAGFRLVANISATSVQHGQIIISNISGNSWTEFGILGQSDAARINWSGGSVSLAAVLTAIRITTVNGTDTFDAGSINILYE